MGREDIRMEQHRKNYSVLWVDDEIDRLRAHIHFLKEKGYNVITATNGEDAVELVKSGHADVVLLDEMMPGLDGLSTLEEIRKIDSYIPIVMITKSEEESLMEEAIGREIAGYIVKPVNPSQILSSLKTIFEGDKIQAQHLSRTYTNEYREIYTRGRKTPEDWYYVARWLADWDIIFDQHPNLGLSDSHFELHRELDGEFAQFIKDNYLSWIHGQKRPTMSVDIPVKKLIPHLKTGKRVFYIVMDCMRFDQWLAVENTLTDYFDIITEPYFSILPTATPYARNALFSGLFPLELARMHPKIWDTAFADEASRNRYEHQLLDKLVSRQGVRLTGDSRYIKILDPDEGGDLLQKLPHYITSPLSSVVVNFLDILAHSRAASDVLKEISPNEAGLRNVMRTWFPNSPLFEVLKRLSETDTVVVLTTDHGSIVGRRGIKAYGKRDTSTSLRYKYGDNLNADPKGSILIKDPKEYLLPNFFVTTNYIIATEDYYFIYPTNFKDYEKQYRNSVVHGGISIEEMIIPVVTLIPRGSR